MSNGERQPKACVFVDGTAAIPAAHPANWSKACGHTTHDQSQTFAMYRVSSGFQSQHSYCLCSWRGRGGGGCPFHFVVHHQNKLMTVVLGGNEESMSLRRTSERTRHQSHRDWVKPIHMFNIRMSVGTFLQILPDSLRFFTSSHFVLFTLFLSSLSPSYDSFSVKLLFTALSNLNAETSAWNWKGEKHPEGFGSCFSSRHLM